MKYFVNYPYSAESLKQEYRTLCQQLHPDKGGSAEAFAEMQNEYNQIARNINGGNTNTKTREYTAQDFAKDMDAMNTTILRGTNKTFADLVDRLVLVFSSEELRTEYNKDGDLSVSFGWDGAALSPLSRNAYYNKFGRELVELAETIAQIKIKQNAANYEKTQHAAHIIEARRNQAEGNKAPKAGAFVFGAHSGLKDCNGVFEEFDTFAAHPEWFEYKEKDEDGNTRRAPLYKVCEIIEVSAEEFADPATADRLVKQAIENGREFPGGAATDDPEPADNPRDPYAKYKYYYTMTAAVVCRESGRWFLIDSEGYDYARYCILPVNFREMFAEEIATAQAKHAARLEEIRKEEERQAAERLAEYRAKMAKYNGAKLEDLTPYKEAVSAARLKESEAYNANHYRRNEATKAAAKETRSAEAALLAAEKRNILAMASHIFPGIRAKVVKAENYSRYGFILTYTDGPKLEDFEKMTDFDLFAAYWTEYRMDDCTETHRHDLTEFADKYGDGHGVEIKREASEQTAATLKDAILKAVPAAAGICWENRHAWTQNEVETAATACGVDGWELWKVYEDRKSYFNYIDAEQLAEWVFNFISYPLEAPKGAKRTQKSAESNESAPAPAEDADTLQEAQNITAPADDLQLIEISGGVAVVGSADNEKTRARQTYKHRKEIKAHGAQWNKDAQRWEATAPENVAKVRAWFILRDGVNINEKTDEEIKQEAAAEIAQDEQSERTAREFAEAFGNMAEAMKEATESKPASKSQDEPQSDEKRDSGNRIRFSPEDCPDFEEAA